jgi:hypothetical protein
MVYIIYRNVLTGFGGTYWAIASEKFKNVKSALKYLESEELGTSFIAKQAKTGEFCIVGPKRLPIETLSHNRVDVMKVGSPDYRNIVERSSLTKKHKVRYLKIVAGVGRFPFFGLKPKKRY